MHRGEVNFRKTYGAVLNLVVLGLKSNMWQLKYNSTKSTKDVLTNKESTKKYICELINQTINSIYSIYQNGSPGKVDFYNKEYLHIKPKDLYLDDEVQEFIDSNKDQFHNGKFFSLCVKDVNDYLFNNVKSN